MNKLKFAIIGGDKRQFVLAKSLKSDGNKVYITGFDKFDDENFNNCDLKTAVGKSDYIVLPVPISFDKINLNTPFSSLDIKIDKNLKETMKNKKIFCYDKNSLINICKDFKECKLYEFSRREDFLQKNAALTAEGAIDIAKKNYNGSLCGAKCLICGFGRIGKCLTHILKEIGADITVSARKLEDIMAIKTLNCKSILTSEIHKTTDYDLIFNTIPSLIFDETVLKKSAKGALLIDLASAPGGVDKIAAKKFEIKVIHALGIPGKMFPISSGEVIKNTIYNMISEGNL